MLYQYIMAFMFVMSTPAWAGAWPVVAPKQFGSDRAALRWNPFETLDERLDDLPLRRYLRARLPLQEALSISLHRELLHAEVALKRDTTFHSAFRQALPGTDIQEYFLSYDGVPLCQAYVRTLEMTGMPPVVVGDVPLVSTVEQVSITDWVDVTSSTSAMEQSAADELGHSVTEWKLMQAERCYAVLDGALKPAWHLYVLADGEPLEGYSDEHQVYSLQRGSLDVEGSVQAYEKNPYDGKLQKMQIDLSGDGTLTSSFFVTSPDGVSRAESQNHEFIYDPADISFAEASVFVHAHAHLRFFATLGYQWWGPQPLILEMHAKDRRGGSLANASYVLAAFRPEHRPAIEIGDGDGRELQNLAFDQDVVSHELGHHIVFQSLRETKREESVVIHEGLADFFTFARTGDDCLGESICPSGSGTCAVQNKCLRSASSALRYTDEAYPKAPAHQKSQVISGMLWDLRKAGAISPGDLTHLVFKTVAFLGRSADLKDFLVALLNADKLAFQGLYMEKIIAAAKARGLEVPVSGIKLAELTGVPPAAEPYDAGEGELPPRRKKSDDFFQCTVASSVRTHENPALTWDVFFWLMMVSTLLLRF